MAAANARRAVEQERLNTWCARVGIESASDLAFWFTSYDQALHEAGRAVADGWALARREREPGMAALVRNLFAREIVRQSRPPQPSSGVATSLPSSSVARSRPSSFAGPVKPKKQSARPSGDKGGIASLFIRDLLGITVTLMPPPFARHDRGSTRVFTFLGWMIRNFCVPLALSESSKPAPVRSTRLGQGQSQAAPLEPGMVTHLLGVLEFTVEYAHWSFLMAAAVMVFGLICFCHVQRSYWCERGHHDFLVFQRKDRHS